MMLTVVIIFSMFNNITGGLNVTSPCCSYFPDRAASYLPNVPGAGILGKLVLAQPAACCSPQKISEVLNVPFVLLAQRGDCGFSGAIFVLVETYSDENFQTKLSLHKLQGQKPLL